MSARTHFATDAITSCRDKQDEHIGMPPKLMKMLSVTFLSKFSTKRAVKNRFCHLSSDAPPH